MRRMLAIAVVALGLVSAHGQSHAQDYPNRPVTVIVPFPAGGSTDIIARTVAHKLGEKWGQQILVDNRPGAGGTIGNALVSTAPADGYTMLVTYAGSQAVNQSLYAKIPFDSVKDFQPVATIARTTPGMFDSGAASTTPCGRACSSISFSSAPTVVRRMSQG